MVLFLLLLLIFVHCEEEEYQYRWFVPLIVESERSIDEETEVFVKVNTSYLISTHRLQRDCSDLKFQDRDTHLIYPYWMEYGCNTEETGIWIHFPKIEEKTYTIDMYFNITGENTYEPEAHSTRTLEDKIIYLPTMNTDCGDDHFNFQPLSLGYIWGDMFLVGNGERSFKEKMGSSTHRHDFSFVTSTSTTEEVMPQRTTDVSSLLLSESGHDHQVVSELGPGDSTPDYRAIHICESDWSDREFGIPQNHAVFAYDESFVEDDFYQRSQYYSDEFLRISDFDSPISTTNGDDQKHTHETNEISTNNVRSSNPNGLTFVRDDLEMGFICSGDHTHLLDLGPTSQQKTLPPHINLGMFTSNHPEGKASPPFPKQLVWSNSLSTPLGWRVAEELDRLYFKIVSEENSDLVGTIGNITGHNHMVVEYTVSEMESSFDVICSNKTTGSPLKDFSPPSHDHVQDGGWTIISNVSVPEPEYRTIRVWIRKESEIEGISHRFVWENVTNIKFYCFNRLPTQKGVCSERGYCERQDDCDCYEEYFEEQGQGLYGDNCEELITNKADYVIETVIRVSYTVPVAEVTSKFEEMAASSFDCSWMIRNYWVLSNDTSSSKSVVCQWLTYTILETKMLEIRGVENPYVTFLEIMPVTTRTSSDFDPDEVEIFNVTVENPFLVDDKDDDGGGDGGSGGGVGGVLSAIAAGTLGGVVVIGVLLLCCVCCCCFCCCCLCLCCSTVIIRQRKKLKLYVQIKDVDIILKEQEDEKRMSHNHLNIRKDLFVVNYDDVKVLRKIGQGGSNSVVFKARWKGKTVAFKCFRTRDFCSDQESFEEFEKEVEILASVNHPNILQFFGATLKVPRVGILMEYCKHKDLKNFFTSVKIGNRFSLNDRIRILTEIASAMSYLHGLNIIHRDIKSENVLINKNLESKLMDFGLSKVVERVTQTKTQRIGTLVYMAPEIVKGLKYSELCDVYSFSILMWEIITTNFCPYGEDAKPGTEYKVANSPHFRPLLKDPIFEPWMKELLTRCWSEEVGERYPFEKILSIMMEHLVEEDEHSYINQLNSSLKGSLRIGTATGSITASLRNAMNLGRLRKQPKIQNKDVVVMGDGDDEIQVNEDEEDHDDHNDDSERRRNSYAEKKRMRKKMRMLEKNKLLKKISTKKVKDELGKSLLKDYGGDVKLGPDEVLEVEVEIDNDDDDLGEKKGNKGDQYSKL